MPQLPLLIRMTAEGSEGAAVGTASATAQARGSCLGLVGGPEVCVDAACPLTDRRPAGALPPASTSLHQPGEERGAWIEL